MRHTIYVRAACSCHASRTTHKDSKGNSMKINLYAVGIIVRSTKTTRRNLAISSMCSKGSFWLIED